MLLCSQKSWFSVTAGIKSLSSSSRRISHRAWTTFYLAYQLRDGFVDIADRICKITPTEVLTDLEQSDGLCGRVVERNGSHNEEDRIRGVQGGNSVGKGYYPLVLI